MQDRVERAIENHRKGYNCAQAVICAYSDLFGMDGRDAFRVSEGFGGGMGGMRDGACGAVTAMYMLAGLKGSAGGPENGPTKAETYARVQKLCRAFLEKRQSVVCGELLEAWAGPDGARPCDALIADACRIVEEQLVHA